MGDATDCQRRRRRRAALGSSLVAAAVLFLAACTAEPAGETPAASPPPVGDTAVWSLADPDSVDAHSREIEVGVMRLACASGITGELLDPVVTYGASEVVIRVDAVPPAEPGGSCPMNDLVPVTVELTEPLGDRALIDGACERADARGTAFCLPDAQRNKQ
jgi:hypothetical protein